MDNLAQCRCCRQHPTMGEGQLFCRECLGEFKDSYEAILTFAAAVGSCRVLPPSWRIPIFFSPRQSAEFSPARQGPKWQGWEWEILGTRGPILPPHLPCISDASGEMAFWEVRIYPPGSALRVHVRWEPRENPEHRRLFIVRGAGESTALGDNDFGRLRQAFDLFGLIAKGTPGRPERPRELKDRERATLALYDEKRAQYSGMSDRHLAKYHVKIGYGKLRYLLEIRRDYSQS